MPVTTDGKGGAHVWKSARFTSCLGIILQRRRVLLDNLPSIRRCCARSNGDTFYVVRLLYIECQYHHVPSCKPTTSDDQASNMYNKDPLRDRAELSTRRLSVTTETRTSLAAPVGGFHVPSRARIALEVQLSDGANLL